MKLYVKVFVGRAIAIDVLCDMILICFILITGLRNPTFVLYSIH